MVEIELLKYVNKDCPFKSYFVTAPNAAKLPYGVLYTAAVNKSPLMNAKMTKIQHVLRYDLFTDKKQDGADLCAQYISPRLDGFRGFLGSYKDVFISCGLPLVITDNGRDFKFTSEINITYYGEYNYGQK